VRRGRRLQPPTVALGALMAGAAILYLVAGRHLTFFFDEWDFVFGRRGESVGTYLAPHNGHLALFPVIVYKVLFALVGLRHYVAYQIVLVALHLLCCALMYVLVRPRLGPWVALIPVGLLLFLGSAWQDLLWPFQIGFLSSVAGGLAALALLERRTAKTDALGSAALVWSVTGSAVGIPFVVACAALLVAQRSGLRRLWVVAVPAVLFVIWYLGWGTSEHVTSASVLGAPQYVVDAAGAAAGGIAGLSSEWGPPLAVAALVVITTALRRRRARIQPLLIGASLGVITFWALSAVARADFADPTASRYVYVGAVFIMLLAAESFAGSTVSFGWGAAGAILLIGCVVANVSELRTGERGLRAADDSVRASLAAVQLASPVVSSNFVPEPTNAPQIAAGPYLAAVRSLGSPALTPQEVMRAPESVRAHVDRVIEQAERLVPAPALLPPRTVAPPTVVAAYGAKLTTMASCQRVRPTAATASVDVRASPGSSIVVSTARGSGAAIYLRRFASSFGEPALASVPSGTSVGLRLPADDARQLSWEIQVVAPDPFVVCAA
jgi:hypothetical protein